MTDYITSIQVGTSFANMIYLESLNDGSGFPFPPPYVRFYPYVSTIKNDDGSVRALGLPHFTLDFGNITEAQRDLFQEAYCPDALQSVVYMSVPTNNNGGEYKSYRAFMDWPNEGDVTRENDQLQKLVIECNEAELQGD